MHVSALSPDRRSRLPPLPHCAPPRALGWDLRQVLWEPAKGTEIQKGRAGCDWWSPSAPRAEFSPAWHPCTGWSQAWDTNPRALWGWGHWGQSGYLLFRECPPGAPEEEPGLPAPHSGLGLGFQANACCPPRGLLVSVHVGSPPICPAAPAAPESRGSGHTVGGHWMFVANRIN